MRCHLATAVTVAPPPPPPNPLRAVGRLLSKPGADGLTLPDHLLAGSSAASVAVSVMHPLDTLKTVLQKAPAASSAVAGAGAGGAVRRGSGGALSALAATLRTGGPAALYRGLAPSLLSQVPAGAIKFAAYETLQQLARRVRARHGGGGGGTGARGEAVTALVDYSCAALAFVACSVALVPGELLKQRLQAGVYNGVAAGAGAMLRADGIRGMYVGYAATLARDVPYTMLEFGLYAQYKRLLRAVLRRDTLTPREELAMGGLAGGCTGFATTPLDLAKTRLMTQSGTAGAGAGATRYRGVFDCLVKTARAEGFPALLKGSAARVVWLVPFTAIYFGVHEATKRALRERRQRAVAKAKAE